MLSWNGAAAAGAGLRPGQVPANGGDLPSPKVCDYVVENGTTGDHSVFHLRFTIFSLSRSRTREDKTTSSLGPYLKYCMPQTVWTFDFKPKRFKRIG